MSKHHTPRSETELAIEVQAAAGNAGTNALRLNNEQIAALRDAWREGVESGVYEPLDPFLEKLSRDCASRSRADT